MAVTYEPKKQKEKSMAELVIGSEAHKERFCQEFIDTHVPYTVESLCWPELDDESVARLRALPFWEEAVSTEQATAAKVQAQAKLESDTLVRAAMDLQGYEEARHSALLKAFLIHYRIELAQQPPTPLPRHIEWAFTRTEYGECFDSFFAFGLFAIAKESGFFPSALVELFDPIMQEEARHILFFVNWVAYRRARLPLWRRPQHMAASILAMALQAWSRVQTARGIDDENFAMTSHAAINTDISPRSFLQLCLVENERRLGCYDRRLLRPRLVPTLARIVCRVLR